mgnify:CR=1 FL=1
MILKESVLYNELIKNQLSFLDIKKLFNISSDTLRNSLKACNFYDKYNYLCPASGKLRQSHLLKNITKEFLITEYVKNNYSANYIAENLIFINDKHIILSASTIISLLKCYNIKPRTITESNNTEHVKVERKKTSIIVYGVENPSQNKKIKQKKVKTFIKNYGVSNIFCGKRGVEIAAKGMIKKYGVTSYNYTEEFKNNSHNKYNSKTQLLVETELKTNNIEFEREVNTKFKKFNTELQKCTLLGQIY